MGDEYLDAILEGAAPENNKGSIYYKACMVIELIPIISFFIVVLIIVIYYCIKGIKKMNKKRKSKIKIEETTSNSDKEERNFISNPESDLLKSDDPPFEELELYHDSNP